MAQPAAINGIPGTFAGVPMADGNGCCGCGGPAPCYDGTCPTMTATVSENGAYPEQDGAHGPTYHSGPGWEVTWNTADPSDPMLGGYYMILDIYCQRIDGVNYWVFALAEQQIYYVGADPIIIGPCTWLGKVVRPTVDGVIQKCPPLGSYVLSPPTDPCAVPPVPGFTAGPVTVVLS